MKSKHHNGFTLIELLVVIAIIGILATVILVSLNSLKARARNARRTADITQMLKAFIVGLENTGSLPSSIVNGVGNTWSCVSTVCYGDYRGYAALPAVDAFLAPFYAIKPTDPTDSTRGYGGYIYNKDSLSGATPYPDDDRIITAGGYIDWMMEPPVFPNICAPGFIYRAIKDVDMNYDYVECLVKIEN